MLEIIIVMGFSGLIAYVIASFRPRVVWAWLGGVLGFALGYVGGVAISIFITEVVMHMQTGSEGVLQFLGRSVIFAITGAWIGASAGKKRAVSKAALAQAS